VAGWIPDAIFFNAGTPGSPGFSGLQLTTVWTVAAAYEHYWTPAVRTSVYGVITSTSFNNTAKLAFCDLTNGGTFEANSTFRPNAGSTAKLDSRTGIVTPGCNPDFAVWGIGVRTIWNPVANLDVGLEVFRDEIDQKFDPNTWFVNFSGSGGQPGGRYQPANLGVWGAMLRVQRNFWP
jgi:hypothetical protein